MREMNDAEIAEFLREGTRTGKLALVTPSGRPTVTPVWFIHEDDGKLRMVTGDYSAKVKILRNDPQACLLVDLEEQPYAFIRVDATVHIDDRPDEVLRVSTLVGDRYMGQERAEEFGQRNAGPGQVALVFTPTRVTAITDLAD